VMERLVRVMRKLNRDIEFSLLFDGDNLVIAMEEQDIEEITGNLLENAARFAKTAVKVALAAFSERDGGVTANWIRITIEDDGPGLEPDQIAQAMKRGKRLDESRPGSGLGLSIVSEVTSEYQGRFSLSRGTSGGLLAELILPAVIREKPKRG